MQDRSPGSHPHGKDGDGKVRVLDDLRAGKRLPVDRDQIVDDDRRDRDELGRSSTRGGHEDDKKNSCSPSLSEKDDGGGGSDESSRLLRSGEGIRVGGELGVGDESASGESHGGAESERDRAESTTKVSAKSKTMRSQQLGLTTTKALRACKPWSWTRDEKQWHVASSPAMTSKSKYDALLRQGLKWVRLTWSQNTPAKPVAMVQPAKTSPGLERIVVYDPSALLATGVLMAASWSRSQSLPGEPRSGEVPYAENTKM